MAGMSSWVCTAVQESAGGHAVASRVEAGSGHEQVGVGLADALHDRVNQFLLVLHGVVVAADQRSDHGGSVAEGPLQQEARADGVIGVLKRAVGFLLAADSTEELVQVVDDPHGLASLS